MYLSLSPPSVDDDSDTPEQSDQLVYSFLRIDPDKPHVVYYELNDLSNYELYVSGEPSERAEGGPFDTAATGGDPDRQGTARYTHVVDPRQAISPRSAHGTDTAAHPVGRDGVDEDERNVASRTPS